MACSETAIVVLLCRRSGDVTPRHPHLANGVLLVGMDRVGSALACGKGASRGFFAELKKMEIMVYCVAGAENPTGKSEVANSATL